jgi:selenide,water dikinase
VGLTAPDDAAVYRMSDEQAIISTADFFPPVVDDPYAYGQIAAANALSDVYAMGGEPLFALNLAGFPEDLDLEILGRIFQGGADKVMEAGAVIAGGHTVTDEEPKYGLAVTGQVHPDRIFTKSGAQSGDLLVLTKPIGTGVITTAHKRDCVASAHLEEATASMCRLNSGAARILQDVGIHACTDVTGYGLLGHAMEMTRHCNVQFEIVADAVPLLSGALGYAENDVMPGGLDRNREHLEEEGLLTLAEDIPPALAALLFDPQTSGGLLTAIPPHKQADLQENFRAANEPCWTIGTVNTGRGIAVRAG